MIVVSSIAKFRIAFSLCTLNSGLCHLAMQLLNPLYHRSLACAVWRGALAALSTGKQATSSIAQVVELQRRVQGTPYASHLQARAAVLCDLACWACKRSAAKRVTCS